MVRGPFSAIVDLGKRKLTLMLDRRYAGRFLLEVDPKVTVEEGHWEVNQKLLTPANASLAGTGAPTPTESKFPSRCGQSCAPAAGLLHSEPSAEF